MDAWNNFKGNKWRNTINVKQFILDNYTEYTGDESFLSPATLKTKEGKEVFKDKNKKFATQFKVVAEYIKGEQPNTLVSLDSSLDVMELMDEVRRQIGVIFPCD